MKIASYLAGLAAIVLALLSFQFKKRKYIMLSQMSASLMSALQYFLIGAFTGGYLDVISFLRTLIFSFNGKKWASSKLWLILFIAAMVGSGISSWAGWISLLPIAGSVFSTVALWMKKEKYIRLISLFAGPCWIIYALFTGAYAAIFNELLAMASIIIALIRHDRKKPEENEI